MESLYNIYYSGELLEGQQLDQVRAKLAALFKANDATLDKLFSGNPQLVKRGCDKPTALKYKQAMENAGAKPLIKAVEVASAHEATPAPKPAKQQTAAERIAALASAPDIGAYGDSQASIEPATNAANSAPEGDSGLNLSPQGTEVLKPDERSEQIVADIDTSALDLDAASQRLSEEAPSPPPAPDTSHLAMSEAGESIPNLVTNQATTVPDSETLDLSPQGTDFSDCHAPEPEIPNLDLSAISLAPEGSEVLEEKDRNRPKPPPPATDHISLQSSNGQE
jgi:hypothetical protein